MEVNIYNLEINGLNTLLIPMTKTDIVSVGMFIKVGSMNETKDNNGIAHFLEHLMFKSTVNRPNKKLLNALDNLGTNYNAGTTRDHTYYEINGAKKDINEIIDIIIDLYCNPVYEIDEIELEKGVVLEEIKMYLDNSSRAMYDYIISEIFKGTPLEKNVTGNDKNIKKFTKEDITNFRKLYTIENSLLVISGNFEKNKVIDIIKENIKKNSFNHSKVDDVKINYKVNINSNKPNVYIIPNKNMNQSYLYVSFYFDKLSFMEECILNFLSFYLSTGSTSKLFEVLRNKLGASYSYEVSLIDFKCESGLFYIYSNINNTQILDALGEILKMLNDLKNENISDEDMKKVKKLEDTDNLFHINNPNYLMMYHGKKYLYGKKENILEEVDIISKLDAKTIKDFCNTFFLKKNLNIFIYGTDIDASKTAKIVNEF